MYALRTPGNADFALRVDPPRVAGDAFSVLDTQQL